MIVDANVFGMFLLQPKDRDAAPIHEWLQRGWGSVVYSTGGRFEADIVPRNRERLAGLVRTGRARPVPRKRVEPHEAGFENIRSDDPHISWRSPALPASGFSIRGTGSSAPISRTGNSSGGTIYKGRADARLLTDDACAGSRRASRSDDC
ncbi:MAG: hypothetical protein OXE57_13195 [Alphaproteobacteria bacterium]|nr:hypothetical protein [Alphaproteobacteria bacterium]